MVFFEGFEWKRVFCFVIYMNHIVNFFVFWKPKHNSQKLKWLHEVNLWLQLVWYRYVLPCQTSGNQLTHIVSASSPCFQGVFSSVYAPVWRDCCFWSSVFFHSSADLRSNNKRRQCLFLLKAFSFVNVGCGIPLVSSHAVSEACRSVG